MRRGGGRGIRRGNVEECGRGIFSPEGLVIQSSELGTETKDWNRRTNTKIQK